MYLPSTYTAQLAFMIGSMVCRGSWANAVKLTPGWRFQSFYWDYVIGVLLGSFLWGMTLGGDATFLAGPDHRFRLRHPARHPRGHRLQRR